MLSNICVKQKWYCSHCRGIAVTNCNHLIELYFGLSKHITMRRLTAVSKIIQVKTLGIYDITDALNEAYTRVSALKILSAISNLLVYIHLAAIFLQIPISAIVILLIIFSHRHQRILHLLLL